MNLVLLADALDKLYEFNLDTIDLYVIAQYKRARQHGEVNVMTLANNSKLSNTLMLRRIKRLVTLEVLAKVERGTDMRFKALTDGRTMKVIDDLFDSLN